MNDLNVFEERRNTIIELIKSNNVIVLDRYLQLNNISIKEINNAEFDLLIYAIENDTSIEMLNFIMEKCHYETLNYSINQNNKLKVPLFCAIGLNKFKIAKYLLDNGANINFMDNSIIHLLNNLNCLNVNKLNYILNNGFNIKSIDDKLITQFITNYQSDFLDIIFKHYVFNETFILKLLLEHYVNRTPMSETKLQELLSKERIVIEEILYITANENNNYVALEILFSHDGSDADTLIKRINKYNLLEKAVKINKYNFTKNILKYQPFGFKSFNFESVLIQACKNNNVNILKLIIDTAFQNTTLEEKYDNLYLNLILNIIIKTNNYAIVKYFLENDEAYHSKLNINQKDINGEYPIISAFYADDLHIFELLVHQGADLKIKNNNGVPLLSLAIYKKKYEIIKCLLKHKVDITEKNVSGNYPLIRAIQTNDIKCVKMLLNYGMENHINMDITDVNGNTPLILSYRLGHTEIFHYLINYLDINKKDTSGNCLLYYAIIKNDIETVSYLIRIGANVNFKDKMGNTMIGILLYKNNINLILPLLHNNNLMLNEPNKRGEIPLIIAIKHYNTLKKSLTSNTNNDYNNYDNYENYDEYDNGRYVQRRRLQQQQQQQQQQQKENEKIKIEQKLEAILDILIEKGSNINYVDNSGKTSLIYAIENHSFSIVKQLIENGANLNQHLTKDNDKSVLMYAIENSNTTNTNINNYNSGSSSSQSTKKNDIIEYLIENNVDLDAIDKDGNTALVYALKYNNLKISNMLIDYGTDVNIINEKGESILKASGYGQYQNQNRQNNYNYNNNYFGNPSSSRNNSNSIQSVIKRILELMN